MVHIAHMSRSLFPRQILIMTLTWPAGGGGGGVMLRTVPLTYQRMHSVSLIVVQS